MKKSILQVLLGLNALMQAGGGAMMLREPAKMARDVFHVAPSPGVEQLTGVIGAATLGFCLLSVVAIVGVVRNRPGAYQLALSLGAALVVIGAGMFVAGCPAAAIDLGKGIVIALVAWLARPAATTLRADPARVPPSSRLRAS